MDTMPLTQNTQPLQQQPPQKLRSLQYTAIMAALLLHSPSTPSQ